MTTNSDAPKAQYPDEHPIDDEQLLAIGELAVGRHGSAVIVESLLEREGGIGDGALQDCWRREEAIGRLRDVVASIVASSTAPGLERVDALTWLNQWLQIPQPALGWKSPGEMLVSREGEVAVARVLGASVSGVYL